ncbi:MAG TPA: hypothetical protein PKO06_20710 [Candidatus Ozemobacteraceae bacterium]|nr:hypothetical protein [Candidatus Ozemobacteraceae bacterium]
MVRKRTCELPFCHGLVEGTRNKRRCDKDRNIHLHQIISKNVKKIMRYIESHREFTANDVARDLFKNKLDKNEKGSMYRLFQAMVRENYLTEHGKLDGLKVYCFAGADDIYAPLSPEPAAAQLGAASYPQTPAPVEVPLTPIELLTAKLREFIFLKNGEYHHEDWLWLINRPDIRELSLKLNMDEGQLGILLQGEKDRYWARR